MKNPDKESKIAPKKAETFSVDGDAKKKMVKGFIVVSAICVFATVLFSIFGGGTYSDDGGVGVSEGMNVTTPSAGNIRMGRTKRENVEIAGDLDRRKNSRDRVAQSSFEWFDKESSEKAAEKENEDKKVDHGKNTYEQKLDEAVKKAEALSRSFSAPTSSVQNKSVSQGAKNTGGVGGSSFSADEYRRRREEEVRKRQEDALARIEAVTRQDKEKKTEKKEGKKPRAEHAEVEGKEQTKGFYGIGSASSSAKASIRAVVHGEHTNLRSGSTVKMRLLDNIRIGEHRIPQNTFIYGKLTFAQGRAQIFVENINLDNVIIPFDGFIYDKDGFEGIYVPDNVVDKTSRTAGSNAVSSVDVNISSPSSLVNSAANAVTGAIKSAVSGSVREEKISISTNYLLTIKQKQ